MKDNIRHIESLLRKYFEGQTSLNEEKELRDYFSHEDIPGHLGFYKPIFDFFSQERREENGSVQVRRIKHTVFMYWLVSGVAACFLLFIGVRTLFFQPEDILQAQSMVYINGKAFYDESIINGEALNALDNISEQNNDIISSQINLLDSFTDEDE